MGQKILVVEDNELNLKLFCDLLRAHGYAAEPVRDGREAVARAHAFAPDLVVMDIQMPHITGLALIEQMKADPALKAIPIMAVTAYAAKGDEERIRDAGAEGYVSKPISVMKFVEAVRTLLAMPRPTAEPPAEGATEPPAEGASEPPAESAAVRRDPAALVEALVGDGIPGIVALAGRGGNVRVHAAGVRSVETQVPMRRDTIFRIASVTKPITAAAAMVLVDRGVLALDDPVDRLLPELADRRVVRTLESPLDDLVPAERPISLRDLLTMQAGFGLITAEPSSSPLARRIAELGLSSWLFDEPAEDYMRRLGSLPLAAQPGEKWLYHTAMDVAGILVARASGMSLGAFLREAIFEPLGMVDSGFAIAPDKTERLAAAYARAGGTGALEPWEFRPDADLTRPPPMEMGGGGLLSTADDLHRFGRMLLDGGTFEGRRILSAEAVAEMVHDQIPDAVKAVSLFPGFWGKQSWGLGMAVTSRDRPPEEARFGWWGGTGTAFFAHPAADMVTIFLSQRLMNAPDDSGAAAAFVEAALAEEA